MLDEETAAKALQRINPRLQVERIAEAGHGLHYDQPGQFITIIKLFLRSILKRWFSRGQAQPFNAVTVRPTPRFLFYIYTYRYWEQ